MRKPISWMTRADDYILNFMEEHDIILSPVIIAINLDLTRQYVSQRCKKLSRADLIDEVENSKYQLNDRGRVYLDGELSSDELPDPDADEDDENGED